MADKILVIGGTGMLGLPVARRLKQDGFEVSVMSTNAEKARGTLGDGYAVVEGDVTKPETLAGAIEGHDFVYLNLNSKLDPEKYEAIEINGTANVAKAASQLGVKRIGMISGASSKGKEGGIIYLDAKVKAERAVIDSGVPYTIMRPSWFFESLPSFIQQGKAVVLGEQPTKFGWLAASDFARQVSTAFRSEAAANKCFYNLGPDKMTMMEALGKFCAKHYPDLKPEVVSFGMAKFLSHMPGMGVLKLIVPFFEYFSGFDEDVDPSEANEILGASTTTLDNWLESWKKPV
ncbi:MAG: SDR family oxidoreductase [Candidatus Zixiibacteriota bacterium]